MIKSSGLALAVVLVTAAAAFMAEPVLVLAQVNQFAPVPYGGSNVNVVNQATSPSSVNQTSANTSGVGADTTGAGTNGVGAQTTGAGTNGVGANVVPTQSQPQGTFTLTNPLKVNSIGALIQNFVDILSYVAVLVAVLALIWVGFMYVMSQGKPAERTKLNNWLLMIVIGTAVIIGARLIVDIVINTLSNTGVSPSVIQAAHNANSGN